MNTEEKIYQKIIESSNKNQENTFAGMDKVWNRVEEKLDQKETKKAVFLWKKMAIAASFLLIITVGYNYFNNSINTKIPINNNTVVEQNKPLETTKQETIIVEQKAPVQTSIDYDRIDKIIKENINDVIVSNDVIKPKTDINRIENDKISYEVQPLDDVIMEKETKASKVIESNNIRNQGYMNMASSNMSNSFAVDRKIYEARSANFDYKILQNENKIEQKPTKSDPLVLIDGKLTKKKKEEINKEDFDSYVVLDNPIYFINGEEFTEQSLFGENPTSKYAPLNEQKIDTIVVLQKEEAKKIYGKKGENGIVIITINAK